MTVSTSLKADISRYVRIRQIQDRVYQLMIRADSPEKAAHLKNRYENLAKAAADTENGSVFPSLYLNL